MAALKRSRDGKTRKDLSNFNFIVITSGILFVMVFVKCEPVCYSRTSQDQCTGKVKMVDCNGSDNICLPFASREDVNMGEILNSRCVYPADNVKAITCSTTNLPSVMNGSFDCAPNADIPKGNTCNLTCKDGFYPPYSNQTVCEGVTSDQGKEWSQENFECRAITCSTTNLPTVMNGSFDCAPNADVPKGNTCNLTCKDGFYPPYSNQTVCEGVTSDQGKEWSQENFECRAITCSTNNLPFVDLGGFTCAPDSYIPQYEACKLTCMKSYGFYAPYSNQAVCEAGPNNQEGTWSNGPFECQQFDCNGWNLWNGSEYKLITDRLGWEESRQLCGSDTSHLVTIENKEENEIVFNILMFCSSYDYAWIGLNELEAEGTWEWSDGTVSKYRGWAEGQPKGNDVYNCGFMNHITGEWYGTSCNYSLAFFCETNNSPR